ncbi:uncharacterized protein kune [Neodiprion pinetum]|uniref:Uncharacterized protein LOC107221874 n=1 Tax=Neodiprion lecontei TaxID=441921 RepID=A0A6J0BRJ0_NEOLC|nr:uncharacterized protein LOC107221874 [Neodiprion lecontei]XP_046420891.1 uncharacterized protein LOC124179992 [Neodiprion fabricii]XP_046480589.1 uncharacterized protein LOC124218171 [Neodiprion pinetum]
MEKSRTLKVAAACTALAFAFVVIAFTTPYWLETDGKLPNPKFIRLGLWEACFHNFEDIRHLYDTRFNSCWWIFEEEYYIIQDFLLPEFFVATQFFFTLCFTLLLVGGFLTLICTFGSRRNDKYQLILWANGGTLTLSATFGIIAVIIFGARGDGRDWMPNWEHNDVGWSYALAVVGTVFLYIGGILFLIEGRRTRKREQKSLMADQKTHTTI